MGLLGSLFSFVMLKPEFGHGSGHIWIQTGARMHICTNTRVSPKTGIRRVAVFVATSILPIMTVFEDYFRKLCKIFTSLEINLH